MEIVWQDPPLSDKGPAGRLTVFLTALREQPGRWALYPVLVSAGWGGNTKKLHPDFEFTCRKRADGKYDGYVRWVGE